MYLSYLIFKMYNALSCIPEFLFRRGLLITFPRPNSWQAGAVVGCKQLPLPPPIQLHNSKVDAMLTIPNKCYKYL